MPPGYVPKVKAVYAIVAADRYTSSWLLHPNSVRNKMATYMARELHLQNFWWKIVAC